MINQYFENKRDYDYLPLEIFMKHMGLSYKALNKEEIDEIEKMDYTYENWEKKSKILHDEFLKKKHRYFSYGSKILF